MRDARGAATGEDERQPQKACHRHKRFVRDQDSAGGRVSTAQVRNVLLAFGAILVLAVIGGCGVPVDRGPTASPDHDTAPGQAIG